MHLPGFHYNRKRKTAHFEVIVPGTNAKVRRRLTVEDVEDRDEAVTKYQEFRERVLRPPAPETDPRVHTLRSYVDENWSKIIARVSPRTARGYRTHLDFVILPDLGALPLERLNDAEIGDFAGRMVTGTVMTRTGKPHAKPYGALAVNHSLAILRRILKDAVRRRVLSSYPILDRLPMQKPVPLRLEMTPEERAAFLAAFDDEAGFRAHVAEEQRHAEESRRARGEPEARSSGWYKGPRRFGGPRQVDGPAVGEHFRRFRALRSLFVVALETGLRCGDLLPLRWESIDLTGGWVRVVMSKTKEQAIIPISPELAAALQELRFRRDESGYVFPERAEERERRLSKARAAATAPDASPAALEALAGALRPRPVHRTPVERAFRIAKHLAGIKRRLRFHDLRHTFASRLASAGVSLQVIAKMLGHTSVQMSQRYARPDERALREAINAVSNSSRTPATESAQTDGRAVSASLSPRGV